MSKLREKAILAITTILGIGNIPLCPGTIASLFAVICFWAIKDFVFYLIFISIIALLAFLFSGPAETILKAKDPKQIVIDDYLGMLITFLFLPRKLVYILIGFFIFRMIDMFKLPPVDRIEKYPGALGVVGDDIIAGIYANLMIQSAIFLIKLFS